MGNDVGMKCTGRRQQKPSQCEALPAVPARSGRTRRAVLLGLTTFAAASPLALHGFAKPAARDTAVGLRIADLVDPDGGPTARARELAGQHLTLAGYAAPALRSGIAIDLYEFTLALCPACGIVHDPGRSIAVTGTLPEASWSGLRLTELTGRLEISPQDQVSIAV